MLSHRHSWRRPLWPALLQLWKRTDWPILIGPWTGEIGFEVLYWIPFVHHLISAGIAPERLLPISRGGASVWYRCPQGFELYALRTPQEVRVANAVTHAKRGYLKQEHITPFERAIVADAAQTMGLQHYHWLHPAWMYHLLAPYWTGWRGTEWLGSRVQYASLGVPDLPDGLTLPDSFVAVRFYARETFPYQDKTVRPFVQAMVQTLAQQSPVVILGGTPYLDDHADIPVDVRGANIHHLKDLVPLTAETNLAVQTAVLARALGFIGTYGGFAQLALRLGKPTISFYTQWHGTSIMHKHLSDLIATRIGRPFQVLSLDQLALMRSVLPDVQVRPRGLPVAPFDTKHIVSV